MLVDEAVVCRDQDVRGICRSQLSHQRHEIFERVFDGFRHIAFGCQLVADGIDLVVIDVDHVMVAEQRLGLVGLHAFDRIRTLNRHPITLAPDCEQLLSIDGTAGRLVTIEDEGAVVVRDAERMVWQ